MPKLRGYADANGKHRGYHFFCPGCDCAHGFNDIPGGWQFNGDQEKPTVTPSLLTTGGSDPNYRCHLHLTNGQIQYLNDCSHLLAGQTIDVPDFPE